MQPSRTGYPNSNNTPSRLEFRHKSLRLFPSHHETSHYRRHSSLEEEVVVVGSTFLLAGVVGSRLPVVGILVVGTEGSSRGRRLLAVGCSNLGHGDLETGWVEEEGRDRRLGGREVGRREVRSPARIPAGVRSLDDLEKDLGMGDIRFWTWWIAVEGGGWGVRVVSQGAWLSVVFVAGEDAVASSLEDLLFNESFWIPF